jgi:hypothetical protein
MNTKLFGIVALVTLLALAVMFSGIVTTQTVAQSACYRGGGGALWVAGSGCEWETQAGSTLDVQGNLQFTPPDTTAVSADFTIVPASAYMVITSTAAVTSSATAAITTTGIGTGQQVIIRNGNASDAIIIDGTGGTVECKANVTLGASDIIALIFNGTDWNCLYVRDNS